MAWYFAFSSQTFKCSMQFNDFCCQPYAVTSLYVNFNVKTIFCFALTCHLSLKLLHLISKMVCDSLLESTKKINVISVYTMTFSLQIMCAINCNRTESSISVSFHLHFSHHTHATNSLFIFSCLKEHNNRFLIRLFTSFHDYVHLAHGSSTNFLKHIGSSYYIIISLKSCSIIWKTSEAPIHIQFLEVRLCIFFDLFRLNTW